MRFEHGMACCNRFRERAGLCCDLDRQLECASIELGRLARCAPEGVQPFLLTLLPIFPPDMVLVRARGVGHFDDFIKAAARHCAALRTLTERRLFADFIAGHISPGQLDTFKRLHEAEWRRLRGK